MEDFIKTLAEIQQAQFFLTKMKEKAISLGASEKGINSHNAWSHLETQLNRLKKFEDQANSLGTTLPNVFKSYRMTKRLDTVDLSELPSELHKVSPRWFIGKRAMTPTQAKQKHKLLLPLMISVWRKIQDDKQLQEELIDSYINASADLFELQLFAFDEDIEIPETSEEEQSRVTIERASSSMEEAKTLRMLESLMDYGVGGSFEE